MYVDMARTTAAIDSLWLQFGNAQKGIPMLNAMKLEWSTHNIRMISETKMHLVMAIFAMAILLSNICRGTFLFEQMLPRRESMDKNVAIR